MSDKKIDGIIDRLWAIRGSYQIEERDDQKKAWDEIIAYFEESKKNNLL